MIFRAGRYALVNQTALVSQSNYIMPDVGWPLLVNKEPRRKRRGIEPAGIEQSSYEEVETLGIISAATTSTPGQVT
ncbi:MAG: hypothetical protein AB7F79_12825 [Steroidobacteraceae bacterium]